MIETIQEETKLSSVLTYRLIAQTPYIHFQHSQDGATVRATEVKPKLDKFILQIAEENQIPHEVIKSWFVRETEKNQDKNQQGENTRNDSSADQKKVRALDYKLRIRADGDNKKTLDIHRFKFYFADMKETAAAKDFVYKDAVLTIICKHARLLELIDQHIKQFFILHNFGSRQSKGFGGFLIENTSRGEIDAALRDCGNPYIKMSTKTYINGNMTPEADVFGRSSTVYSAMKGGINDAGFDPVDQMTRKINPSEGSYQSPDAYVKGFILRPFLPADIGSDKAFVKACVLKSREMTEAERKNPILRRRFAEDFDKTYDSFLYVRALLGVADHFMYRDDLRCEWLGTENKKGRYRAKYEPEQVHIYNFDNMTINDKGKCVVAEDEIKKNTGVKRFKSPITIKMFRDSDENGGEYVSYQVRFVFNDSYKSVLSKIFIFMNDTQKNAYKNAVDQKDYAAAARIVSQCAWIRTPEDFDPKSFIKGFVNYFNSNEVKEHLERCRVGRWSSVNLSYGNCGGERR